MISDIRGERLFGTLTRYIIKLRVLVLLLAFLFCGGLATQLKYLQVDTSNEGFLHKNDPILITYNDFRDQFGRDDMVALAIESDGVFTVDFLEKLKELHEALGAEVPHVNEITSMVNARNTRGEGDMLLVDDLLEDFPDSQEALVELRKRVMENPLYRNQLISEKGNFTTIIIESEVYSSPVDDDLFSGFDTPSDGAEVVGAPEFLSDKENSAFVKAIREVASRYSEEDFKIYMAGSPVVMDNIKQFMMKDTKRFVRLALITVGICLLLMFRRFSGVFLPLLVVALSFVTILGIMAVNGVSFKLPTTILPSFLLAVGVGASVHVLSLTFLSMRKGLEKKEAIVAALSHSGLAIVITSLTTAAGLASFSMAKVAPIADLGLYSSLGVVISLIYTLTVLPALLSFLPLGQKKIGKEQTITSMDRVLDAFAEFSVHRYRLVLAVFFIVVCVALAGVLQVSFSHNALTWLPREEPVRQATQTIDRELKGSVVLEVILDTGRVNGLYDRRTLLAMEKVLDALSERYADSDVFIGKANSVTTILKEIHRALHENRLEFYAIPDNEKLIPQEFLLFENSGSDDLEDVVDSQFQIARITLKVPWQDALLYVPFIGEVGETFRAEFEGNALPGGQEMTITITGIMSLFGRIIHAAIYSAAQSYGIALVVITLLMILLIGDLRLGLVSMIPNLGPIFMVLGIMGWCGIALDMFTMLIASIAIGLAVDDTVHFMYNFKRYYGKTGDVLEASKKTLHTAGRAMLTTSAVLSIGFFIFTFASMNNLFYFGILTGIAILLALVADLILAPALMTLFIRK